MRKKFLLVTPSNDAESVEAANLAREHGVQVLVTGQPWGASWKEMEGSKGLEPTVEEAVRLWQYANPDGTVYGLELRGENDFGAKNIDHHYYTLPGGVVDDRRNPKSSLEQVAEVLNKELTNYQKLVCANDASYIPGMEAELRKQGIDPASAEGLGLIDLVRRADRCAQGVTPDDEASARNDVNKAEWRGRKVLVHVTTRLGTAQSDLLYGRADEQLHVNQATGKWVYFGPRHLMLNGSGFPEQHWAGGDPKNGYFGIASPGQETQQKILEIFWEDKK